MWVYFMWFFYVVVLIIFYCMGFEGDFFEEMFCLILFNVILIFLGMGYGDGDVMVWGLFVFVILFCVGVIGGCLGFIGCFIKVFCY